MKRTALLSALLLASCHEAADEQETRSPEATPVASVDEISGEYRIAGVDGSDIDLPHAITASIDGERIHVVSDCVNLAWAYRIERDHLMTERTAVEGCARGLEPTEQALLAALDVADTVRRTPANAIEFSGGGHSVTLFSQ